MVCFDCLTERCVVGVGRHKSRGAFDHAFERLQEPCATDFLFAGRQKVSVGGRGHRARTCGSRLAGV